MIPRLSSQDNLSDAIVSPEVCSYSTSVPFKFLTGLCKWVVLNLAAMHNHDAYSTVLPAVAKCNQKRTFAPSLLANNVCRCC